MMLVVLYVELELVKFWVHRKEYLGAAGIKDDVPSTEFEEEMDLFWPVPNSSIPRKL